MKKSIVLGLFGLLASGCSVIDTIEGKQTQKTNAAATAAPVDTELTGAAIAGGSAVIKYKSNIPDAKFKCQTEVQGQAAGAWADCSADGLSIPVQAGVRYTVRVKAIAPDGTESRSPVEYTFDGGQSTQAPGAPTSQDPAAAPGTAAAPLVTQIQSPTTLDAPGGIWKSTTLHLVFGAAGGSPSDSLRFECRQAPDTQFTTCNKVDDSQNSVDLSGLKDGDTVALDVRAVDRQTGVAGQVASLNLRVQLTGTPGGIVQPVVQAFQLGSFYEYIIPAGMHVTEYATTKNFWNRLSFYRISTPGTTDSAHPLLGQTDPYYVGNYSCTGEFDKHVPGGSPSGTTYDYCDSDLPHQDGSVDMYKWLTDSRLAYNHIEVATDANLVTDSFHEYISMNMFDSTVEYMYGRSRFEDLCSNAQGTISQSPPIRVIDRDFWGEAVRANFFMCVTNLVIPSGAGLPSLNPAPWMNRWYVGSFFITSTGLNLPSYECITHKTSPDGHAYDQATCGKFANPSLLEVTFVTKQLFDTPADFAADAQQKFLQNLQELNPVRH